MEVLDALPEAVVVLDAHRRVVRANARCRALLGMDPSTAVGCHLDDVLQQLDRDGKPCATVLPPRGVSDRLAERVVHVPLRDGRDRAVSRSGTWLPDGGLVLTFRSAGRREALDVARADVVATVAHELRAPLTSVRGFVGTLLARWDRFDDAQKHAMLQTVEADAERVTRLLQDLLEVARIDARRVPLRTSRVDLAALLADVVARSLVRPDGRDRDVRVVVDDDPPGRVEADQGRVEQVVTNLVDNALRHAPAARVRVRLRRVGDEVEVEVADDGPGVAPELWTSVFDKFGRGRSSARGGTGLGLYIARGLARAHGGDLRLGDSDLGGASFTLVLPLVQQQG